MSRSELSKLLDYCPDTGLFTWLKRNSETKAIKIWNGRFAGQAAGSLDDQGYVRIVVNTKFYKAHRLAWLLTYGEWPTGEVDHVDGNRSNNAIANLRDATRQQNQSNRRGSPKNKSGRKGVSWHTQRNAWQARIKVNGKGRHLGTFDTPEEASEAYAKAAAFHHGAFAFVEQS